MPQHLLTIGDLTAQELATVLDLARQFKAGKTSRVLAGKSIALLFEKPSLRTKVSFDLAVHQLGGHPIYMGKDEVGMGSREPVADVARTLARYVDGIVARVFRHKTLEELAQHASVPVINALSDQEHPCQALGDLLTIHEKKGRIKGVTVAFIGDGNNVASSLAVACAAAGANFAIASPDGHQLPRDVLVMAKYRASQTGANVNAMNTPWKAVQGADVVYTDVWTSMGQEAEAESRRKAFEGFRVDEALLAMATPEAILMHCMPAHYGEEVPPGMLDHPQSVAFDQAENRLHAQKAVFELLFSGR